MSGEVRVAPISMRIENLDLTQLVSNLDNLRMHGIKAVIPYSLNAYVNGKLVGFVLNFVGNRPTVTMSSDDPAVLDALSRTIQETFRGHSE
jgi:hypothetical protein